MALPLPKLDSRTFDELTRAGVALIPSHAPDWTDHNASDPGITLLELYAWVSELLLYRADRVTPAMVRATLRAVGVEPAPATVARAAVAVRREPGGTGTLALPADTPLVTVAGGADFATTGALAVSPAWLELGPDESGDRGRVIVERAAVREDVTAANRGPRTFAPLGPAPAPGDALALGFDVAAAGAELSLFCWTPPGTSDPPPGRHHAARTVWEYSVGADAWRALDVVADDTRALTRTGRVLGRVGPDHAPGADGRWWVRCRLAAGGYECPPVLATVAVNAIEAAHAVPVARDELVAVSRGQADQEHALRHAPLVPGSLDLRVGDERWVEVPDWDRSRPADPHFRLDSAAGRVVFGNGRRGRVPEARADIVARSYRRGSGALGNLPPGSLVAVGAPLAEPVAVVQPFGASGGADAEPLGRAHGRALARIHEPARAVTAQDIETLAAAAPGLPVGRVRALPGVHPDVPCVPAAGVVTVVVLPSCGRPPVPSEGFLAALARYLEPRRPLASELIVVGPRYVDLEVSVTVHARPGAPADLGDRAVERIERFCDPLRGGPDGAGWPFGRDVLAGDLLAMLGALDGVAFADRLELAAGSEACLRCGAVTLCPTELVNLRPPRVAVEWE